ncbi:hypothetical protein MHO82_14375 [Vibrio sp. Of7-15]|uniref:hypothetical protein n=1 Tax=Vibrio sp. Of7-15 TaxID=2724879 RepID=UPI001EF1845D|nr:hypothetical protein [Vibrio sp. Of7-15]MCG7498053.1 hypothetical protein [Vibrio sp. Of7-15]
MQFKIFKRRVKDTVFGSTKDTAIGVQRQDMADARMGATYMLAKTDISKIPSFSTDLAGNFLVGTEPLADMKNISMSLLQKTNAGRKVVSAVSVVGEAASAVIQKIKAMISEFFQGLLHKIKSVYGETLWAAEWVVEYGTWMAAEFAGNISNCIPGWGYVQNAADIYSGVKQAIFKSKDFVTQMYASRGVNLLGGHPSIIANALARHSLAGVAGGLKTAAVGITKTGLEAAGDAFAGIGTLVSALSGMFDRVIKAVDWMIQTCLVDSVLTRAKKEWNNRASSTSLVHDHKRFSEWFQNSVITTPVIAALVMGSGFVAHPNKFLQLLNANGTITSQDSFSKGIVYIEKLKDLSTSYVQEYTDGYGVDFTSKDGMVSARLAELKTGKGILHGEEIAVTAVAPLKVTTV